MKHPIATSVAAALIAICLPRPSLAAGTSFETAEAAVAEGNIAFAKGDMDAAATAFEAALAADPDNIEAMFHLGLLSFRKGQYSQAAERLAPVCRAEPQNAAARIHLGISYFKLDRLDQALDHLRAAEASTPNAQARFYSGLALHKKGDRKAASSRLDEAAALDPSLKSSGDYLKGVMLMESGKTGEGLDVLTKIAQAETATPAGLAAAEVLRGPHPPESRRLNAGAELAVVYDSNVILQSRSGEVPLPAGISDQADVRTQLNAHIAYGFHRSKEWQGDVSYRLYEGVNSHLPHYNFHLHEARIGGTWTRGSVEAGLPYSFAYSFVSDSYSGYSFAHSLAPTATVRHGNKAATRFTYEVRHETFLETPVSPEWDRTGTNHKATLFEFYTPIRRLRLGLGYAFEFNDPNGRAWRYMAHHVNALAAADLWKGGRAEAAVAYAFRDFDTVSSDPTSTVQGGSGEPRADHAPALSLTVAHAIYRDWLEASLSYAGTFYRSNAPRNWYDWDRQLVGASLRAFY
jgi:tetratricopeptide (TPR) repeat protein